MKSARPRTALILLNFAFLFLSGMGIAGEPVEGGADADAVEQALAMPNKRERLGRIDELLGRFAEAGDPGTEARVLRLLNARAALKNGRDKMDALDGILARYAGGDVVSQSDAVRSEIAQAMLEKARAVRDKEEKVALLDRIIANESGSESESLQYQVFSARNELAKLESSDAEKRKAYDAIIADLQEIGKSGILRIQLATAMNGRASATSSQNRAERYDRVIRRFENSKNTGVQAQVIWAKRQRAGFSEADARVGILGAIIRQYKDVADDSTQKTLASVVNDLIKVLEGRPEAQRELRRLVEDLAGTVAADKAAGVLMAMARMETDTRKRVELYEEVVAGYGDPANEAFRNALQAAEKILEASDDKDAVLAMCDGLVAKSVADGGDGIGHALGNLVLACVEASDDAIANLRRIEHLLEYAKPGVDVPYLVDRALKRKAEILDDWTVVPAFYDECIAAETNDRRVCRLLYLKISVLNDDDQSSLAAADELIGRYLETRDPEIGDYVLRAIKRKGRSVGRDEEFLRRLDTVIANFSAAEGASGMLVLASALLEKAEAPIDEDVKIGLYDRIAGLRPRFDADRLDSLRERAVKAKSQLLENPEILVAYYRDMAETKSRPADKAKYLRLQAEAEPSASGKLELFQQVVDTYGNSKNRNVAKEVTTAILGKAKLAKRRTEAETLYREALRRMRDAKSDRDDYAIHNAYEALIGLTSERGKRLEIYDEEIAFYRSQQGRKNDYLICSAIMSKAELVGTREEKIALLDEVIAICESGSADSLDYTHNNALMEKAEATTDMSEKIALLDRVLERTQPKRKEYLHGSQYVRALSRKARELKDESILERELDSLARLEPAEWIVTLGGEIAGEFKSPQTKIRAYDRIIASVQNSENPGLQRQSNRLRAQRAMEAGEDPSRFFERDNLLSDAGENKVRMRALLADMEKENELYKALLGAMEAAPNSGEKIRLIDAYLSDGERPDHQAYDLLFRKAELIADKAEKIRFYESIIERAETGSGRRYLSNPDWFRMQQAYREIAGLLDGDAERLRLYDGVIEKYSDSVFRDVDGFLLDARLARVEYLPERTAKIGELKSIIAASAASDDLGRAMAVQSALRQLAILVEQEPGAGTMELLEFFTSAEDKLKSIRTLLDRADGLENASEKKALLDDIVARYGTDPDPEVARVAADVRLQAIALVDDPDARIRILDEMLSKMGPETDRLDVVRVLREKIAALSEPEKKIRMYDEIIHLLAEPERTAYRRELYRAIADKAGLLDDPAARADLYAKALSGLSVENDAFSRLLYRELLEKMEAEPAAVR